MLFSHLIYLSWRERSSFYVFAPIQKESRYNILKLKNNKFHRFRFLLR